jgi:hypothetical protein
MTLVLLRGVPFQPNFYLGASQQFGISTWSSNDLCGFNARRINGHGPLFSLDPTADSKSYASVFHRVSLDPNQKGNNANSYKGHYLNFMIRKERTAAESMQNFSDTWPPALIADGSVDVSFGVDHEHRHRHFSTLQ